MLRLVLALGVILVAASPVAGRTWQGSWGAPPTAAMGSGLDLPPDWMSPELKGQTIVQSLRLSVGGERLRLRLTNEYGDRPLSVGRARVSLLDAAGQPVSGSEREVTFAGGPSATIPPGAPLLSDPIELVAPTLARIQVGLFLPGDAGPCTCHGDAGETARISPPGDFTDRTFKAQATTRSRAFLSGVEVESEVNRAVVVVLGDSITDGYLSTPGANHRWPDRLAERLAAQGGGAAGVVNAGIGGNRMLAADVLPVYGQSALARFDRDVLSVPGVSHLVVLEGINDIGGVPTATPESLIAGYRQLIARARAHGIKVFLATLLPYEGAPYYRTEGEQVRQAVNDWMRRQTEADGVIDFDRAMRDPGRPSRLRADLQGGDWLHPNDAGYRTMGETVDTSLFK